VRREVVFRYGWIGEQNLDDAARCFGPTQPVIEPIKKSRILKFQREDTVDVIVPNAETSTVD
jgi:hypothetical protein